VVKGDVLGRAFTDRQPQVRAAFDPLETAWRAEMHDLLARAAHERTQRGRDAAAGVLAGFTRRCVDEALATADRCSSGSPAAGSLQGTPHRKAAPRLTPKRRRKNVAASTGPEAAPSLI
jgi:hypothetical protein